MYIGSIVLAGGRSRRMGKPKEALPFLDTTLLGRTVEAMLLCTHPVVVVARDEAQELPPLPLETEITYDGVAGGGPLVALAAGLRIAEHQCDAVFVTSCDMPFLNESVIAWLADQMGEHDLVIPRSEGVLQPLAALYRTGVLAEIERLIAAGVETPRTLAEKVSTRELSDEDIAAFDPERRFLRNINNPEEYEAALRAAEKM